MKEPERCVHFSRDVRYVSTTGLPSASQDRTCDSRVASMMQDAMLRSRIASSSCRTEPTISSCVEQLHPNFRFSCCYAVRYPNLRLSGVASQSRRTTIRRATTSRIAYRNCDTELFLDTPPARRAIYGLANTLAIRWPRRSSCAVIPSEPAEERCDGPSSATLGQPLCSKGAHLTGQEVSSCQQ